mgnify:CR=1 FL=1
MNCFDVINDYSDYEINNENNDENHDDEIEPTINANNLCNVLQTNEELKVSPVQSPDESILSFGVWNC